MFVAIACFASIAIGGQPPCGRLGSLAAAAGLPQSISQGLAKMLATTIGGTRC